MRWSAAQALSWIICQQPLPLSDWFSDMGPEIARAQREISAAIADKRIMAWGRPELNGKAHGSFEQLPDDIFRNSSVDVTVGVHGDVGPVKPFIQYDGPRWRDIEFDANAIKRTWPASGTPTTVIAWMLTEAKKRNANGRIGKRDDMLKACMAATGCTKRDAEAAHKSLPPELRRARGKPPRHAG